ncbi:hypothetical protein HQ520_11210 [bacterium]|nr:hypothetical protein [bacterium]
MDNAIPNVGADSRKSRLGSTLKLVGLLGLVMAVLTVLLAGGMLTPEMLRELPAPRSKADTTRLLALNRDGEKSGKALPRSTDVSSPSTVGGTANPGLKFQPLIPDAPDIPGELRARANEFNARFDAILLRIEEYEGVKNSLTPDEAMYALGKMEQDCRDIFGEMAGFTNHSLRAIPKGGQSKMVERYFAFQRWYYPAILDAEERGRQWKEALGLSKQYRKDQYTWWGVQSIAHDPSQTLRESDFDKGAGRSEYERGLYYCRQVGGKEGLKLAGGLLFEQKKRAIGDFFTEALDAVKYHGVRSTVVSHHIGFGSRSGGRGGARKEGETQ